MAMKKFEIHEEGNGRFTTIEARTAVAALRKACREYPRRAADYNGYRGTVTWRAFSQDADRPRASAEVTVPGRGARSCKISGY